jgi:hypothetical protein
VTFYRIVLLPLIVLSLNGCGDGVLSRVSRLANISAGNSGMAYDPVEARKMPYATMNAKIGISLNSLMVLRSYADRDLHWAGADGVLLVTRQGRVMATNGLDQDLMKTSLWTSDPIVDHMPATGHSIRIVDLKEKNLYGISLDCQWNDLGPEEIDIFGQKYKVNKVTESCSDRHDTWFFQNIFWRDKDNFVWKSVQNFSPGVPALEFSILKPAR